MKTRRALRVAFLGVPLAAVIGATVAMVPGFRTGAAGSRGPGLERKATFTIDNGGRIDATALPLLEGKGSAPITLQVSDIGAARRDRRVKVFVCVYERPSPSSHKVGKHLSNYTDPGVLVTPPDGSQSRPFACKVPLLPGEYLAYVFLCDIDQPMEEADRFHPTFPPVGDFPGSVKKGMLVALRVH